MRASELCERLGGGELSLTLTGDEQGRAVVGGVEARRGRPDLSPSLPLSIAFPLRECPCSVGAGMGVACGGEDAPVGKGPRRTRPHPGARTKYIAPLELQ